MRGLMLRSLDAEIMQADIRSPESLRRILSGIDTVIHLGARAAFEPYPRLYPSIVKGSLNLMQAAIEAGLRGHPRADQSENSALADVRLWPRQA